MMLLLYPLNQKDQHSVGPTRSLNTTQNVYITLDSEEHLYNAYFHSGTKLENTTFAQKLDFGEKLGILPLFTLHSVWYFFKKKFKISCWTKKFISSQCGLLKEKNDSIFFHFAPVLTHGKQESSSKQSSFEPFLLFKHISKFYYIIKEIHSAFSILALRIWKWM